MRPLESAGEVPSEPGANFEFNRRSIDLDYRRPVIPAQRSVLDAWALNAHNAPSLIALNACGDGGAPVYWPKRARRRLTASVFLHFGRPRALSSSTFVSTPLKSGARATQRAKSPSLRRRRLSPSPCDLFGERDEKQVHPDRS